MSNAKSIASGFFNKNAASQTITVQPSPPNALRSIFDIQKLDESEERQLEKLLVDEFKPGGIVSEEQVAQDLETLKHITAEVKGISKQGVLLIGERIHKAREILKNYGDGKGSLKKWLEITFSNSRRTAYNALAYFDFHQSLPDEKARFLLKKMPQKAAYVLASREGGIEIKTEIVRDYHQQKAEEIIPVIQERLPLPQDKEALSKDATTQLLEKMDTMTKKLQSRKNYFSDSQKEAIEKIISTLQQALSN
jgi:hypothetical protein